MPDCREGVDGVHRIEQKTMAHLQASTEFFSPQGQGAELSQALKAVRRQARETQRTVQEEKRLQKLAREERQFSAQHKRKLRIHNNGSSAWEQQQWQQRPWKPDLRPPSAMPRVPQPPQRMQALDGLANGSAFSPRSRSAAVMLSATCTARPASYHSSRPSSSRIMASRGSVSSRGSTRATTTRAFTPMVPRAGNPTIKLLQETRDAQLQDLNNLTRMMARLDSVRVRKKLAREDISEVLQDLHQIREQWEALSSMLLSTEQTLFSLKGPEEQRAEEAENVLEPARARARATVSTPMHSTSSIGWMASTASGVGVWGEHSATPLVRHVIPTHSCKVQERWTWIERCRAARHTEAAHGSGIWT